MSVASPCRLPVLLKRTNASMKEEDEIRATVDRETRAKGRGE